MKLRDTNKIDIQAFIRGEGAEYEEIKKKFDQRLERERNKLHYKKVKAVKKARSKLFSKKGKYERKQRKKQYSVVGTKEYNRKRKMWAKSVSRNLERIVADRQTEIADTNKDFFPKQRLD